MSTLTKRGTKRRRQRGAKNAPLNHSPFGYALSDVEPFPEADYSRLPSIPQRWQYQNRAGEWEIRPEVEDLANAVMDLAMAEMRRQRLAAKRRSVGGHGDRRGVWRKGAGKGSEAQEEFDPGVE
jgi:hypothetical protein